MTWHKIGDTPIPETGKVDAYSASTGGRHLVEKCRHAYTGQSGYRICVVPDDDGSLLTPLMHNITHWREIPPPPADKDTDQ